MWHGLSGAWFEEGVVCAWCGLSRGRRVIAGHGCEGLAGAGQGLNREWLWVERG